MGTINPAKTHNVTAIAHSRCIHPDSIKGTEIDVSGDYAVTLDCFHGYVEDVADTNPGFFRFVKSNKTTGDNSWNEFLRLSAKGTDPDKVDINASEAAGQTDLTVSAVTGLAAGDLIYLQDTNGGAPASATGALSSPDSLSEWAFLRKAVTTTATVMDGITNAKDASDDLYNDASHFTVEVDCRAIARLRVDWVHEGTTGANCDVMVIATRHTEETTA